MGNGIKYTEDFKNIDNPNDLLDAKVGKKNVQVRRWVNELFLKKGSQSQARTIEKQSKPTRIVTDKPTSPAAAIEALNNNESPFSIGSNIVSAALARSDAYKTTKRGNATIHSRADGKDFVEQSSSVDFQHLGERVYSDVAQYLGMEAPQVGFVGSGSRRGILSESVDTAVDGAKINRDIAPNEIPSIEITPVDTTGAGDAFVGAVLFQLSTLTNPQMNSLNKEQWISLFTNANKAGARTCEYLGAMEAFKHLSNDIFN
jgi:hypothetical protein